MWVCTADDERRKAATRRRVGLARSVAFSRPAPAAAQNPVPLGTEERGAGAVYAPERASDPKESLDDSREDDGGNRDDDRGQPKDDARVKGPRSDLLHVAPDLPQGE